ncbi:MAG: hypothetical protein U5K75_09835 [Ahrensia sp.]|nr:hypothetical protein [Ahrensia sp.]
MLNTKNNASLIKALGADCDAIADHGAGDNSLLLPETKAKIAEITERNVKRRQIRFPKVFNQAPIAALYRTYYKRQSTKTFRFFREQLEPDKSRVVLVFNGYLAPNALLDLAAQHLGMKCLYIENGFFPKTMQADPSGINALSTLPRDAAFYDALTAEQLGDAWPDELVTRRSKLPADNRQTGLPEKYIFVPFQVPSDMQILALSPWIKDMVHLYNEVLSLAAKFESRHFVIKEHPSFPLSIQGKVKRHPRIAFCNQGVTRELIAGSDAVLTINSTVGLEAVTLGKKVITLGDAHYAIDGITLKAKNADELQRVFATLDEWDQNHQRCENYVRFVYNHFLLPLDRENAGENTSRLLTGRATKTDQYSKTSSC